MSVRTCCVVLALSAAGAGRVSGTTRFDEKQEHENKDGEMNGKRIMTVMESANVDLRVMSRRLAVFAQFT